MNRLVTMALMDIRILRTLLFYSLLFTQVVRGQSPVTNQRLFDTIPFIPEHYPQRIAQFEKEPLATGRIIFLGNSITEMGRWDKLIGDSTVVNRGIGGDITFGVLKRMDDIIRRKPSKLFLLIGINDIGKDIPDLVIADNIRKIIRRVQNESPSTVIYLESILPVNPDIRGFPQHYDKNQHVVSTNALLKNLAMETKITLIDTYSFFEDGEGKLKKEYTIEGLHINPGGYQAWIKFLKDGKYLEQ
ncbi:MAG TPA: GDSL-type esterase/lipase family protein [Puia sp.]|nr:GDSL-type esterase/lipase family protein [Puia sp.]